MSNGISHVLSSFSGGAACGMRYSSRRSSSGCMTAAGFAQDSLVQRPLGWAWGCSRCCPRRKPLHLARKLHRREGEGRMATEGTGKNASRDLGQGWKVSPSVRIEAKKVFTLAEITGPGAIQHIWMTPTGGIQILHPPVLLGRRDGTLGGSSGGRFLRLRVEPVRTDQFPSGLRESGSAFNCYWRCRSVSPAASPWRTSTKPHDPLLSDRLHAHDVPKDAAYLHAQFAGSIPCRTSRSSPSSKASRAGAVCRNLHAWCEQQRLVG